MRRLTPRQQEVLDYLCMSLNERGCILPLATVAELLGMKYVSLKQHLEALDKKGFVVFKSNGVGRAPTLSIKPEYLSGICPTCGQKVNHA